MSAAAVVVTRELRAPTLTVLVVDADSAARTMLTSLLEQSAYHVLQAADATTALRLIHSEPCDLVVLDVDLPGVNGLSLCRLLRSSRVASGIGNNNYYRGVRLPVIITSAHADEAFQAEAFAAGADDFIVKSADEIMTRLAAHLETVAREQQLAGSNRELFFLVDLSKSLLQTLEPEQVARQVAGATYAATNAALCAVVLHELSDIKNQNVDNESIDNRSLDDKENLKHESSAPVATAVFDREGSLESFDLIHQTRFTNWLKNYAPHDATQARAVNANSEIAVERLTDASTFLLKDKTHKFEIIVALRFAELTLGCLIVAFDKDCSEAETRLIEAAGGIAALAAHISMIHAQTSRQADLLAAEVARRTAEIERGRRFTEAIIDSLPVSLHAINREHEIVAWNRHRELGTQGVPRESAIGRNIFDVLTRQSRRVMEQEFEQVFTTSNIERIEQTTVDGNGKTRHWLISKIPMFAEADESRVSHVITVGEETTARVEANRAVARAEKLAAVGRLASGVVHEINNPLATISACAEALESRVLEGVFGESSEVADLREYLSLIRSEAFRCKSITNGLLDFSRMRAGEHRPLQLKSILESAARLLMHQQRGKNIEIKVEAADDLPLISGDEGQLQQAVIALSTNAIDAMPHGGTLTLRAREHHAPKQAVAGKRMSVSSTDQSVAYATRREASSLLIEVSDTGIGITPEDLPKIFDPFFTTKEIGQGTGLGLAVCYGIVAEHGGRISVESTVARGTTFTITLPVRV